MSDNFGNLLSRLLKQRGFTLQKISPTTLPGDVISRHRRRPADGVREDEFPGILGLIKSGSAFRCRIGKARYWYGTTPSEAIQKALKNEEN